MAAKKKDPKVIPVGEGAELEVEEVDLATGDGEESVPEKQEEPVEEEVSEEESGEEERVGHSEDEGEDDKAAEARREKRRRERKNRREKDARLRREVNFLRSRNEQVERRLSEVFVRQSNHEAASIEGRISDVNEKIRQAEDIYSQAITKSDGETAAEALRVKDALMAHRTQLESAKPKKESSQKEKEPPKDEPESREGPRISRDALENGRAWMGRNSWFDPQLKDQTSYLVKSIEDRLAREGEFTAEDPEYWEELDRRVKEIFPQISKKPKKAAGSVEEIFDEDDDDDDDEVEPTPVKKDPPKKKGGPKFSVGGKTRALKPNEVFISAERRKALEDAGVWEDEETRDRFLKSYKRYDEEAALNNK